MTATPKPLPAGKEKPHYHGHRDRLRQRFKENGPDALQDYELVELILFSAIPRRDVKPLAKKILAAFGDLSSVMNAPVETLTQIDGISDNTALLLKAMTAISHRAMKQDLMQQPILNSWTRLLDYCHATMAHEQNEQFRILFMNKKNRLIADEVQQVGTIDHTPAYPREVIKRALELGASAIILLHNHPSGDHRPSEDDVNMTHAIVRAGDALNIRIHDHVIISRNGYSSFKNMGLL